ncbi:uncharacterized protein TrAFT101_000018 [Trichoderma asperellum]|uniref:uncharacterized protein n=1 Tax=Trichoderma asperellum TaxID=101201 RepID=UPI003328B1BD|nr:hypothetical protein TrAFT101_000018 [Trichoderma asperellum]
MVLSLLSNDSLEDVAAQRTDGPTPYAAGYNAVILTVDAPMYGRRLADERNNWSIIPPGATFLNVAAQHVKPSEISVITSKEDVENAIKYGVDGIIISNNGGRQLDTTPATIDIL